MKLRINTVRKRIWFWSKDPYARERGLLWIDIVVGYTYEVNGEPFNFLH